MEQMTEDIKGSARHLAHWRRSSASMTPCAAVSKDCLAALYRRELNAKFLMWCRTLLSPSLLLLLLLLPSPSPPLLVVESGHVMALAVAQK